MFVKYLALHSWLPSMFLEGRREDKGNEERTHDAFQGQANVASGHQKCKTVFLLQNNFPVTFWVLMDSRNLKSSSAVRTGCLTFVL